MRIAFCGVISALSVVLMFLTGLVPIATLAIPAIAGCFLIPVVVETNVKWGFGTYATVAVLSFLIAPDRQAALFYVFIFGYYPVLFAVLGKIKKKPIRLIVKLLIFNAAITAVYLLSVYVMGIPIEDMGSFGEWAVIIYYAMLNITFVIYDFALNGLIVAYINRLHNKVKKYFR